MVYSGTSCIAITDRGGIDFRKSLMVWCLILTEVRLTGNQDPFIPHSYHY